MAVSLSAHEVSDLCLGKPALRSLSISSTIADALTAFKVTGETYLSVWSCDHNHSSSKQPHCQCVGKICMVDIVCFLSEQTNLSNPSSALQSPVSALLPIVSGTIKHVEPHFSLVEAIDLILEGAQNLVIPIKKSVTQKKKHLQKPSFRPTTTLHNGSEFCWITSEDIIRYLLNLIGLFSPIAARSVESLGLISTNLNAVGYHNAASLAVGAILDAHRKQTSVAVVGEDGTLIGEISPFTLACCDVTVAAAITTLSAGDLMAYIDCGGPPEDILRVVKARLKERNLDGLLDLFEEDVLSATSGSSSDEELSLSPTATLSSGHSRSGSGSGKYSRFGSYSTRMVRRAEAIVCHPKSSLVAVMVQALAHRVTYVWVLDDDYNLVGIVTFSDILDVFREHLQSVEK